MNNQFDVIITPTSVYFNGDKMRRKYTGSSRKIYLNKKYVVKVEWRDDRKTFWQCRHENSLWKRLPMRHRKFFVPTLFYFHCEEYDYTIQPRISVRNYDSKEIKAKRFLEIEHVVDKYGLSDIFIDLNCNWGIHKGKSIIFDYGV